MPEPTRILIVDDDPQVGRLLSRYLEGEGFTIRISHSANEMRAALKGFPADLLILDLGLPGEDGLTLTREIRRDSSMGIIILTGKDEPVDRVVGLELGADDYVTKPFDERELLARIRTVLRRTQSRSHGKAAEPGSERPPALRFADWRLDLGARELTAGNGDSVELTTMEFELLSVLVSNPNRVMSRDQLLERCTGRSWDPYDRAIDTLIVKLRRKLESDPKHPQIIKTVRGAGYIFTPPVQRA
ncbi:MAG TPA: response regulator transcription factor [Gammaproteobacteria bacterium]|nr:response regulator transcription factor [Gammaproteobacteria bacterium]